MEKVRLGIIGAGNMGSGHVQNILAGKTPEVELAAVADRRADRREWLSSVLPESVAVYEEGSPFSTISCIFRYRQLVRWLNIMAKTFPLRSAAAFISRTCFV